MKETIKENVERLSKEGNKQQLKKDILECYSRYKKYFKRCKDTTGKGYRFTNRKMIPYQWKHTKEENKKSCYSSLLWVFHIDRYSNLKLLKKNKRILSGVFKEDKEITRILNYSYKVILRDGGLK